jgi:uncharacterized protein (TIGR00255 family)
MIRSMTAYARREIKGSWGSASWELRSVNQRYLETYFRLPEQFRSLEPVVRERIRARLTRGKIECNLRFEPDASAQGELILNEKLAKQLVNAANWVKMQSDEGEINPVDILRWPGVMAAQEQDLDAIAAEILSALDGALDDFIVSRETEGQALKALIEQRLEGVSTEVKKCVHRCRKSCSGSVTAWLPNWKMRRFNSKIIALNKSWCSWRSALTLPKSWIVWTHTSKKPGTSSRRKRLWVAVSTL